ncbi:MAG: MCE family protein [Gammaproteobacteria bacterium]|nr:MCE family protein [Gammaproteobacteria bacterium]
MSKQTSPTLIGAFVVGAVALIAVSVTLFGGSEIFKDKSRYVTYFDRSVKGLRVGSNVLFKGVRIGYVTDISVVGDIETLDIAIPVVFEVLPDAVTLMQGDRSLGTLQERDALDLDRLIDAGLRAQLNSESLITGQLVIELDLFADTEAVFRGHNTAYPEIPSIPSDIQQALEDVRRFAQEIQTSVDIREVMSNLQNIVAGVDRIVNSEEVERIVTGVERFINSRDTQELTLVLRGAGEDLRVVLGDTRKLVNGANAELTGLVDKIDPTLANLDAAIAEGNRVLEALNRQIGTDSETQYELVNTLNEIQSAARALRVLLEYLEQHPESIVRGKQE